ncbi:helix-turn-helix domain-containing protein [Halobacterium hubeiense]|uniref:helix-turn-helix domain-containing protein n=1 Tax=Halobacterium hubeiense TaxID=1407499 RepID=UPI0015C60E7F|nr:helix-turn-helix domain-containing protein [Halobacterium hubeiense]
MQELVVTLEYDEGIDPVMDLFIDHPRAVSTSEKICRTDDGLWLVDRVTGPDTAMEAIDEMFGHPHTDEKRVMDEATHVHRQASHADESHRGPDRQVEYDILNSASNERVVSTYTRRSSSCHHVLDTAMDILDSSVLFSTHRRERHLEWEMLIQHEESLSSLYDELENGLRDGIELQFDRIQRSLQWSSEDLSLTDLPYVQREALEVAVDEGYFETPREIQLSELADVLSVPQSTLRYRLRRAESWLATEFVGREITPTTED